ncbi:MAG TPA: radical SAM/Cys-rich domain protein, partial [Gammaproteobacteria bacterium]|nr:radical SAM/Cys-rich domain protein [Gammaproteobacteria bacterium]
MLDTTPLLKEISFPEIQRESLSALQVNLGYRCNLSCIHCHVNAGPKRSEMMDRENIDGVIRILEQGKITQLDLTGGAPELNPHFKMLVEAASKLGVQVIDRCNLSVLELPEQQGLAQFLADHRVEVVASMPCYLEDNVDAQRGKGTFSESIKGLKRLNKLGYGSREGGLVLNLVYNPQGASLPPDQQSLEVDYKRVLRESYGIVFNQLLTIANLPIHRFGSLLLSKGEFSGYMDLLQSAHQPQNLATVMCRTLISVDWQG